MKSIATKVLVVGGGPGGYVAAIRAGQLGLDVTLVESVRLGGTCLVRGCIPSKALIHAAGQFEAMTHAVGGNRFGISLSAPPSLDFGETIRWKDAIVARLSNGVGALLKRAKVKVVNGWATFSDAKTCEVATAEGKVAITAEHVVLANGSEPVELPFLPFGGPVLSSTEALSLSAPPKRLVVVGAGYIGVELGTAFRKLGSEVTLVEALDDILPAFDRELAAPVSKWLSRAGVTVLTGAKAKALVQKSGGHALAIETQDGEKTELPADAILVTVGRRPLTKGWGLEAMAVDLDGPFVKIDDQCRTSVKNVWAIGDLVGEPMLAHKASAQGEIVAEIIAGKRRTFDPAAIPAVCFTEPEIVSVGLNSAEAAAKGIAIIAGQFPFSASGRALSMDAGGDEGFVRVIARADNRRVLGVQAVGAHVSEMSGEFTHAIEMGAVIDDVAGTIHAHPTLSEAFGEAAMRAIGMAIHI
ncbi:dihydrolipoyl dehydrogenase [Methylocapsa sp. S129]|uniref:dihydrolipoyl dehydrogenase n=1 Tax=Methylocapsa sp. S129 TaxID=1641869 RepID=UPI00131CFE0B|nr:dihydrolipoyl dehydrogenase [Methylocapsa sp. S129]